MCGLCDDAATVRLQFKTDSVKLLRVRLLPPRRKKCAPRKGERIFTAGKKRTAGRFRLAVNFDLSVRSKTNISLALII